MHWSVMEGGWWRVEGGGWWMEDLNVGLCSLDGVSWSIAVSVEWERLGKSLMIYFSLSLSLCPNYTSRCTSDALQMHFKYT